MSSTSLVEDLARFFKTARYLWGRCPRCGDLFRVSEAAISFGSEPPTDWLHRLQRRQQETDQKQYELQSWQGQLEARESQLADQERVLTSRERNLEKTAREMAKGMIKDDKTIKALLKDARQQAIQRSRSTLLGSLFERLAPFFARFDHDPRDVRPLMNPIDYIVFDGITINRRVERIVFVEVKCGTSSQTPAQKSVFQAVREGRVSVETWQVGKRGIPLEQQLLGGSGAHAALPQHGSRENE